MTLTPLILTICLTALTACVLLIWRQRGQLNQLHQQLKTQQQRVSDSETEKQRAEAANQAKNRYLSGISHELRTPLNVIMGYAQILERQAHSDDPNQRSYQLIRQNCQQLTHLIEGILEFSAIESGKLRVQSDIVELRPLLNHLTEVFDHQARQKNLEFDVQLPAELPRYVKTDSKRLQQILTNLLSNAVKFTSSGQVSFHMTYRNQIATFAIKDTGIGIKASDLRRIFQPFERIESTEYKVPGTGLGLTITQLLADLLGGELTVDSQWQQGTTFTLKLMLSAQQNSQTESSPKLKPAKLDEAPVVLVVDDVDEHRELVRQLLAPLGFQLLEADHAIEAQRLIAEHTIDLALLDVSMPDMDGWQLAGWIRDQGHDFHIIMLSANPRDNSPQHPGNHQAYLAKPLQVDALLTQLDRLLELNWQTRTSEGHPRAIGNQPVALRYKDRTRMLDLLDIGHINGIKACVKELLEDGKISQQEADRLMAPLDRLNLTGFAQLIDHDR